MTAITPTQRRAIFAAGKRLGMDHAALQDLTPHGSIAELSVVEAGQLLDRLNKGSDFAGGPAQSGRRQRRPAGVISLVTAAQRDKIASLRAELGWTESALHDWLSKRHFTDGRSLTEMRTAEDAIKVIELLKSVAARYRRKDEAMGALTAEEKQFAEALLAAWSAAFKDNPNGYKASHTAANVAAAVALHRAIQVKPEAQRWSAEWVCRAIDAYAADPRQVARGEWTRFARWMEDAEENIDRQLRRLAAAASAAEVSPASELAADPALAGEAARIIRDFAWLIRFFRDSDKAGVTPLDRAKAFITQCDAGQVNRHEAPALRAGYVKIAALLLRFEALPLDQRKLFRRRARSFIEAQSQISVQDSAALSAVAHALLDITPLAADTAQEAAP